MNRPAVNAMAMSHSPIITPLLHLPESIKPQQQYLIFFDIIKLRLEVNRVMFVVERAGMRTEAIHVDDAVNDVTFKCFPDDCSCCASASKGDMHQHQLLT